MLTLPPRIRALLGRHGSWLSATATGLLFVLCFLWIWHRRDLLRESFRLPLETLWIPLLCGMAIQAGTKPFRHRWLLARHGVQPSYFEALRDRLVMTALKTFVPWMVGDPYGYMLVSRRWKLEVRELASFWLTDKWLTLVAIGALAMSAAMCLVLPVWAAAGIGLVCLAFVGLTGIGGLRAQPGPRRLGLLLLALAQEVLHMAGFVAILAPTLDGGMGSIRWIDVALVHTFGLIPTMLGGAGSREAATLLLFAGMADDRALFLAAFGATLMLRVLPSLPGILMVRSSMRTSGRVPAD